VLPSVDQTGEEYLSESDDHSEDEIDGASPAIPENVLTEKKAEPRENKEAQEESDNRAHKPSIPLAGEVANRLKLDTSYKKIIKSCQSALEKFKGELVPGKTSESDRTFMITSAHAGEGVTVSALVTGIALSKYGHSKVLLVDVNTSNPKLQKLFSIKKGTGFAEYISGTVNILDDEISDSSIYKAMDFSQDNVDLSWAKCTHYTEYPSLYVMPYSAHTAVSLWNVVEHENFQARLNTLKGIFDYIVFDSSAIMDSSEPALLCQHIDGVIMVLCAEKTRWEIAELAINTVKDSGGVFVGGILNRRKFYIPKFLYGWL